MPIIAGADGCRGGWICIKKDTDTGTLTSGIYPDADSLIHQQPVPSVLMIDIPIGLTDDAPRDCDLAARQMLGNRHVCVFPAPIRGSLAALNRADASVITNAANGSLVGVQAWGIFPKVRDIDHVLAAAIGLQNRVYEVHPEVCFCEWNGGVPIQLSKKTAAGLAARQALIAPVFGLAAFHAVRAAHLVTAAANDDIADAFAALWTAGRKNAGVALQIPAPPSPVDAVGLRMEMWY